MRINHYIAQALYSIELFYNHLLSRVNLVTLLIQKGIYSVLLSSLCDRSRRPSVFYILIFSSKISRPIGTKLGRYLHWMVMYKVNVISNRKFLQEQETQRYKKKIVISVVAYYMSLLCGLLFSHHILIIFLYVPYKILFILHLYI